VISGRNRQVGLPVEVLAACLVFAMATTAPSQTGSGFGSSAFSGGAGWFSGRLVSNPIGFHPVPSLGAFPGSAIRSIRPLPPTSASTGLTGGFSASNPFVAFFGNPMAPGVTGRFDEPLSQIAANASSYGWGPVPAQRSATTSVEGGPGVGGTVVGGTDAITNVLASLSDLVTAQSAAAGLATSPTAAEVLATPGLVGPGFSLNLTGGARAKPPTPRLPLTPREDLQHIIARSTSLGPTDSIRVLSDGTTVFLRGTVANAADRTFAEALLRLSPGVDRVQNELTIK